MIERAGDGDERMRREGHAADGVGAVGRKIVAAEARTRRLARRRGVAGYRQAFADAVHYRQQWQAYRDAKAAWERKPAAKRDAEPPITEQQRAPVSGPVP